MRCKVGDMVIVTAPYFPENAGRVGTVRELFNTTDWVVDPTSTFFGCDFFGRMREGKDGTVFLDSALTPIRPGDLVEDTETNRELEHS